MLTDKEVRDCVFNALDKGLGVELEVIKLHHQQGATMTGAAEYQIKEAKKAYEQLKKEPVE